LLRKWWEMSVTAKEDVLLQNWERQQEEAEKRYFRDRRVECPELTLDWAKNLANLDINVEHPFSTRFNLQHLFKLSFLA
jgi:hypothetical protein